MSLYEASVPQFTKMLGNLDTWLEKGAEFAKKKGFDQSVLLSSRLAPDQYPLTRQIQSACDSAKFPVARLTAKEAPKHPDTEQTVEELRRRIALCREYLATVSAADFKGAEEREIALPFLEGKLIRGRDYLNEMALPNFYFHITTAYAILRNLGVDLGKMDYIGSLTFK
ncbi:MAG TPA: DUF1993 domain-containing protein [Polyangiaceae bacterium]